MTTSRLSTTAFTDYQELFDRVSASPEILGGHRILPHAVYAPAQSSDVYHPALSMPYHMVNGKKASLAYATKMLAWAKKADPATVDVESDSPTYARKELKGRSNNNPGHQLAHAFHRLYGGAHGLKKRILSYLTRTPTEQATWIIPLVTYDTMTNSVDNAVATHLRLDVASDGTARATVYYHTLSTYAHVDAYVWYGLMCDLIQFIDTDDYAPITKVTVLLQASLVAANDRFFTTGRYQSTRRNEEYAWPVNPHPPHTPGNEDSPAQRAAALETVDCAPPSTNADRNVIHCSSYEQALEIMDDIDPTVRGVAEFDHHPSRTGAFNPNRSYIGQFRLYHIIPRTTPMANSVGYDVVAFPTALPDPSVS